MIRLTGFDFDNHRKRVNPFEYPRDRVIISIRVAMPAEDVTHSGDIVRTEVPAGNVTDSNRDIVSMEIGK